MIPNLSLFFRINIFEEQSKSFQLVLYKEVMVPIGQYFFSFSAAPTAYGTSKARDWIQAVAMPQLQQCQILIPLCQANDWTWASAETWIATKTALDP